MDNECILELDMNEEEIQLSESERYDEGMLADKTVYINGGELYVVATPIGRIVDLTIRASRVLEQVDLIAAEDTRRAYIMLNILGIRKKVISNQKFNEYKRTDYFISELKAGKSVAVISDAGTPCISDPGNELIIRAIEEGIKVTPIPGACAAVTGVSASGFDLRSFVFRGFFPRETAEKKDELLNMRSGVSRTYIYYESPKRIKKTMEFFVSEEVPCRICLCNDLTKTHERFYRGTPEEVLAELNGNENSEKGEYTLIVEVAKEYFVSAADSAISPEAMIIDEIVRNGGTVKDATAEILKNPLCPYSKNELKAAGINLKNMF